MWSLGVIGGVSFMLCLLALCAFLAYGAKPETKFYCGLAALVIVAVAAFGLYPYDLEHYQYRHVSGTVQEAGIETTSGRYWYVMRINNQDYVCDDSRCALIKQGDQVTISCIKTWVPQGTDISTCNYISRQAS